MEALPTLDQIGAQFLQSQVIEGAADGVIHQVFEGVVDRRYLPSSLRHASQPTPLLVNYWANNSHPHPNRNLSLLPIRHSSRFLVNPSNFTVSILRGGLV